MTGHEQRVGETGDRPADAIAILPLAGDRVDRTEAPTVGTSPPSSVRAADAPLIRAVRAYDATCYVSSDIAGGGFVKIGEASAALTQCLGGGSYRCRPQAAALAPALSALEWAEQQVETSCP